LIALAELAHTSQREDLTAAEPSQSPVTVRT